MCLRWHWAAPSKRNSIYRLGQKIVLTHGMSSENISGILDHGDKPFTVVGILNQTATPVDRSLYITLQGDEAMHIDSVDGAPPMPGQEVPPARSGSGTFRSRV